MQENVQNNYGLTEEEIKLFKQEVEQKKRLQNRQDILNNFLNDKDNKDAHKELYEKGGLKELIDGDPDILDTPTAFKIALKTSKDNYLRKLDESKKKESESVAIQNSTPLTPQGEIKTESKKTRAGSANLQTIMSKRPNIKTEGEALMVQWFNPNLELDE